MRIELANLLLFSCLFTTPCWAVSHWVTPDGSGDFPTIQAAVDAAADGDTISLADGVHKLQSASGILIYGKELVIRSLSGDPNLCMVEAFPGLAGAGFRFASAGGRDGVLEGVTVMNARAGRGAGIYIENSSPTIRNCILRDNEAISSGGGGIWVGNSSHPLIEDCHIHHNKAHALGSGGGIRLNHGSIEVYNCIIEYNSCIGATQIGAGGLSISDPAIIRDCIIRGNTTQGYGGGLYCSINPMTIENCLIVDNSAGVAGGGIFLVGSSNPVERIIRGCTISNNDAPTGAGIYNWRLYANTPPPPLTIENCIIAYNNTSQAVKCDNAADPVIVTCSDIYGNEGGDWTHCIYGQDGIDGNFSEDPRFCNIYGGNYALDSQSPCLPENNSCGVLIGVYGEGCEVMTALPGDPAPLPGVYNFPNPFNPETQIVFALTSAETVTIRIFDSAGRVVRDLIDAERYPAGSHRVHWRGLSDAGRSLPSGVYHCRVAIGQSITSTKMTLLK